VFADGRLAISGAGRKPLGTGAHFDEHLTEVPGSYIGGDSAELADDVQCQSLEFPSMRSCDPIIRCAEATKRRCIRPGQGAHAASANLLLRPLEPLTGEEGFAGIVEALGNKSGSRRRRPLQPGASALRRCVSMGESSPWSAAGG
jgi:hypothetical protein